MYSLNLKIFIIWKDKIESNNEFLVIIKTKNSMKDKIVEILKDHHEYEIPVISYDFNIHDDSYKEWFCRHLTETNIKYLIEIIIYNNIMYFKSFCIRRIYSIFSTSESKFIRNF